jgi:hypothetical protein
MNLNHDKVKGEETLEKAHSLSIAKIESGTKIKVPSIAVKNYEIQNEIRIKVQD